ncbi:MAG: glycosyltransferase family 9 protein [Bacteroidota bacterium]|nr:glycosyltransferase family 9 protein [Candidatus Kapabacteria bacterium]MCS7302538.1 glycosyltransferase family 9 protein [Candidatus Kapabacteria bacterium]MCX7936776.1 glycosyltransferase family 9 protein [Chlorobiota bacterium]MDW8074180.1 glycosyltransferase family 9 protein [Bacteroidota bacterium]MDW8271344.1 glycosyltransferase family 9 protein [Bacteroidota bacterium]
MQQAIAIIQTAFLGDIALGMLFADQVGRIFPDRTLVFICRPDGEALARSNPAITQTIVFDKRGRDRGISGIMRLSHQLHEHATEIVFGLQRSIRTSLVAYFSRAPIRVGFTQATGSMLYTHRIEYPSEIHEIERNAALLTALGIEPPPVRIPLPLQLTSAQRQQVDSALERIRAHRSGPIVAVAPGAVWATKRWLPERFASVAAHLWAEGFGVAVIGGKADVSLCNEVATRAGVPDLAGMLDPAATVEFLRSCALLIANDSAPTHLATLAGCPTLTIFGSTIPAFGFAPRAPGSQVVEPPPLPCRPCGSHGRRRCPRGTLACMHSITTADVLERASIILRCVQ